jgi:hypothetical protein
MRTLHHLVGGIESGQPPWSSRAAPTPCNSRAAISHPSPGASAHNPDPSVKPPSPTENARFAPMRSDNEPALNSNAANTSV